MTVIAVPFGTLLAFIMVRTDVPGRRLLEPLLLVPIFFSAVVLAFGYVVAVGPGRLRLTWVQGPDRRRSLEHLLAGRR